MEQPSPDPVNLGPMYHGGRGALLSGVRPQPKGRTAVSNRILKKILYRLGPLSAAVLLIGLVAAQGAFAGANVVVNPGFETGSFNPAWSWGGSFGAYTDVTPVNAHSGTFTATIGYPWRPANIESWISTGWMVVPYSNPTLSYWIRPQCTSGYDSFRVTVRDQYGGALSTAECTTTSSWIQRSINVSQFAGRFVYVTFDTYTRGYGWGATYTLLDDVSLSSP